MVYEKNKEFYRTSHYQKLMHIDTEYVEREVIYEDVNYSRDTSRSLKVVILHGVLTNR